MDESSEIFVGRSPDPFVCIFEQVEHYFGEESLLFFLRTELSHADDDFDASLSDGPIRDVKGLAVVKSEESGEKLFGNDFGDDGKVDNRLLSDFEAGVFPEREELQSDELLAEGLAEDFAHVGEELDCDNSIFLIGVVVSHFNDVPEDKIASFMVVDLLGELSQEFSGLLLDLGHSMGYVERVEVQEINQTGNQDGLYGLLGLVVLFEVLDKFGNLVQEHPGDVFAIFDLDKGGSTIGVMSCLRRVMPSLPSCSSMMTRFLMTFCLK